MRSLLSLRKKLRSWNNDLAMSETPAEAPAKKKSPLPVVIALVAVLGGGGFFMMKGKGEAPKTEKTVIKLAHEETELEEFLVNMADGQTYLKTKIAVKLDATAEGKIIEENKAAVEDAVVRTLRSVAPADVKTDEDIVKLKRKIAAAMNRALGSGEHGGESHGKVTEIRRKFDPEDLPPDWDSSEGPVLQVFFKSFATQ